MRTNAECLARPEVRWEPGEVLHCAGSNLYLIMAAMGKKQQVTIPELKAYLENFCSHDAIIEVCHAVFVGDIRAGDWLVWNHEGKKLTHVRPAMVSSV